MELPLCPSCQRGRLLPMSSINLTFCYWTCSSPDCSYVVSSSPASVTFYKGHAIPEPKERAGKSWTEFDF